MVAAASCVKEAASNANCGPWQVVTVTEEPVLAVMASTHGCVLAFEQRPVVPRFSVVSAVSVESAPGMGPFVSPLLPERFSVVSAVSSPSASGRTPVRLLFGSASPVTRPLVTVTPCQWPGAVAARRSWTWNVDPLPPTGLGLIVTPLSCPTQMKSLDPQRTNKPRQGC